MESVTFENTTGWVRYQSENEIFTISAEDLADKAKAAEYLKQTYYNYVWTRE